MSKPYKILNAYAGNYMLNQCLKSMEFKKGLI